LVQENSRQGKLQTTLDLLLNFPRLLTHDKRLKNVENELEYFFESISGLGKKVLTLLLQLPPTLTIIEGLERLRVLTPVLDDSDMQ